MITIQQVSVNVNKSSKRHYVRDRSCVGYAQYRSVLRLWERAIYNPIKKPTKISKAGGRDFQVVLVETDPKQTVDYVRAGNAFGVGNWKAVFLSSHFGALAYERALAKERMQLDWQWLKREEGVS